jgi:MerR family transcriptional regulator, light-induced transcriptional regulator
MANYSIKDLEVLSGIKAHTIRIWEKRYQLIKPGRTCTNIRLYTDEDLKRILNISMLNRNGLKISHIAQLSEDEMHEKIVFISQHSAIHDDQVENLVIAMVEYDEARFDKIFTTIVFKIGFEETMLKVILPLLEKVGVLWQTGTINPAQEHFVTNLIRSKLIVAIDSLMPSRLLNPSSFILFLPEGEQHELGLLYYYYLIRKRGHHVLYLGSSVPLKDVKEITGPIKPAYLVSYFVAPIERTKLQEYMDAFAEHFDKQSVWLSGMQTRAFAGTIPSNVSIFNTPGAFQEALLNVAC